MTVEVVLFQPEQIDVMQRLSPLSAHNFACASVRERAIASP
jgi:hypothetical protein